MSGVSSKTPITRISTKIYWVPEKYHRLSTGELKIYRRPVVRFPFPREVLNKLGINVQGEKIRVIIEIYDDGSFCGRIPKEEIQRILKQRFGEFLS